MPQECKTQGVHHVGLTVPNIQQTRDFFVDVLGFTQVGEKPTYPAVFVSDGHTMLTLWQAADPDHAQSFDRSNCVGLPSPCAQRRLPRHIAGPSQRAP